MKTIVTLAGDGIGPEIMESALVILDYVIEKHHLPLQHQAHLFGGSAIDQVHVPLPNTTLEACQKADAILLAAIGGPKWTTAETTPEQGLLELRKTLALYANIRPVKVSDSLVNFSPLKKEIVNGTDLIVVRELTSGIYFGTPREKTDHEAIDTNYYHVDEITRVVRYAFELAKTRRQKVCAVDKANVLATSRLWRETVAKIALDYPECEVSYQYVDSVAMDLIKHPTRFDVIVTENLFGDILSDETSVLPGSLGVLPSASHGIGVSLYEPIHGSAPDIAGKHQANPISMILSVAMMLRESFGYEEIAKDLEQACAQALSTTRTPDLNGQATTTDVTHAVLAAYKGGVV